MPMVLRSRKSIRRRQAGEVEPEERTPAAQRRSARLQRSAADEDSEDSEPESVQGRDMDTHQRESPPAELEDGDAEEMDAAELKHCSVVLDRLHATKKELEEMNRRGGKPVSRIPTFHKRPPTGSQQTELPLPKKDTPVHVDQPHGKAGGGDVEASMSKPAEARETALPSPSVRAPKIGFESPSSFSTAEAASTAHSSLITAPKSWSLLESLQDPFMTASPRPALRPEPGSEGYSPEQERSRSSEIEADTLTDGPVSPFPHEGSLCQDAAENCEAEGSITLTASGDAEKPESAGEAQTDEVSQVDAIMDEEPPWKTELINMRELKDSRSSSDVECEEDLTNEKSEHHNTREAKDHQEADVVQAEFPKLEEKRADRDEWSSPVAPEEPAKVRSTKAAKSSGCSSFALFFFLPTTLLLLGGMAQHVWHYGLPLSVAQLTAQLELHWLEGFGLVPEPCSTDCRVHLVESIPVGLYQSSPSSRQTIADSWTRLLDKANSSVYIAAFYFSLRGNDLEFSDSSDSQGQKVFEHLKQLESKGVNLQIAVNAPQTSTQDTAELAATGAEVREVDLKAVTGGIIHTKLWVVDQKHFYLGSANMDWRSLSQVKEVGLSVEDCSCLAQDAFRIFGVYWSIGGAHNGSLPPYWPARLSALSNSHNPLRLKFNGVPAQVYLSSSPPPLSARGRSDDLSTILSVINDAQKFVYISVMDYLPLSEFTEPLRFWPAIDTALRAAACTRGVQVRLMVSCWPHSPAAMFPFLQSLLVLSRPPLKCDIDIKIFTVPSTPEQMKIPFARVNHAKYMVTDRVVYIGTSNWSENYFTQTAGVGLVVNQTGSEVGKGQQTVQSQAEELFLRDWRSQYASALSADSLDVCPRHRH